MKGCSNASKQMKLHLVLKMQLHHPAIIKLSKKRRRKMLLAKRRSLRRITSASCHSRSSMFHLHYTSSVSNYKIIMLTSECSSSFYYTTLCWYITSDFIWPKLALTISFGYCACGHIALVTRVYLFNEKQLLCPNIFCTVNIDS